MKKKIPVNFFNLLKVLKPFRDNFVSNRKILLTRFNGIGDFITFIPVILNIKLNLPFYKLVILCDKRFNAYELISVPAKLIKINPADLNNIFYSYGLALKLFLLNPYMLITSTQERGFYEALCSHARIRAGYPTENTLHLYTHPILKENYFVKEVERNLEILRKLKMDLKIKKPSLHVNYEVKEKLNTYLSGKNIKKFIVLNMFGKRLTRWLPLPKAAKIVKALQNTNYKVILTGTNESVEIAQKLAYSSGAVNMCGQLTLKQLVALIELSTLVISVDSGPMHIADALNKPLIAIFGPGDIRKWAPFSGKVVTPDRIVCGPCYKESCRTNLCMKQIDEEKIIKLAKESLC